MAHTGKLAKIQGLVDKRLYQQAEQALIFELVEHPGAVNAMQMLGKLHCDTGNLQSAWDWLTRALVIAPTHAESLVLLAQVAEQLGQSENAAQALADALNCATSAAQLFAVSAEAERHGATMLAITAIERALAIDANDIQLRLQYARLQQSIGQSDSAANILRDIIHGKPKSSAKRAIGGQTSRAWFALMDLKTIKLNADEYEQLKSETRRSPDLQDQALLHFALGKAHEDESNFKAAFDCFIRANQLSQPVNPWSAKGFEQHVVSIQNAFDANPLASHDAGSELIFLVGLPRSGTTLVEQVLAAHPNVEGASELPYLPQILQRESTRRGKAFPLWVADATPADWQRLADHYLKYTAKFRQYKPKSTDKLPENWLYLGAIQRMFPQCKVIDCLRDPVETTWSCYKQLFAPGKVPFSYRFSDLGTFWRGYRATMSFWQAQNALNPRLQIKGQSYEHLVSDTESQVRALLDFCNLDFSMACLESHLAQRAIRTPSAAQVRKPMTAASIKALGYGDLLNELRSQFPAQPAFHS